MKKELCPHCGASMMINRYSMNKALVRALFKLSKRPGVVAGKIGFTRVEYSVYTKLKFWELIEPTGVEDGMWGVTDLGRRFLRGDVAVPKHIGYFRNRLVERSEDERVTIRGVFPTEESKQKYRELMTSFEGVSA